MPKYLSGRVKRTPQNQLTEDRYLYLGLDQTEPNLGDPPELDAIPAGTQYQIVSVLSRPGERFWKEVGGGTVPAAHTVRDEGLVVPRTNVNPNLGINSITDVNFTGLAVTVTGSINPDGSPGTAVTITVAPPGNDNEILFNNDGEFATSSLFKFDNSTVGVASVGIGTTQPTQNLHVAGNFRLEGIFFDEDNNAGSQSDLLVKTATGGLKYASANAVRSGAGGTIGQIQFHDSTGLVGGASTFYYDYNNHRVGIGSTQPDRLLDVFGDSRFTGFTTFVGFTTFTNDVTFLTSNLKNIHFDKSDNSLKFGDQVGAKFGDGQDLEIYHNSINSIIANGTGILSIRGDDIRLQRADGTKTMLTAAKNGAVELYFNDTKKFETTDTGVDVSGTFYASGISTFNNVINANGDIAKNNSDLKIKSNGILLKNSADNETYASFSVGAGVTLFFNNSKKFETTGAGITVTGLTTTTDLGLSGKVKSDLIPDITNSYDIGSPSLSWKNLYVQKVIGIVNQEFQDINVTGILTTKDLHVTGFSSFIGVATFHGDIDVDGHAELDNVNVSGALTTQTFKVSGISSFVGTSNFTNVDVGGIATITDLDVHDLHVGGASTFVGVSSFQDNVIFNGSSGITSIKFNKNNNALEFVDNAKLKFGDSAGLEIYHGQSPYNTSTTDQHSYIRDTGSGDLVVLSNQFSIRNAAETKDMARFYENGTVELRYDNNLVLQTTGYGVSITGLTSTTNLGVSSVVESNLSPSIPAKFDLGEPNLRWNNLYVKNINVDGGTISIDDFLFGDLFVTGVSTFIGVSSFGGGFVVESGISTFNDDVDAGNINSVGVITATDFNSTSDAKLKTNIQVIDNPIEKIMKIDGVSFNWKSSNKPSFGVIADNVQETLPDLVNNEDPKTVNYNGLVGLLIEVVKNQQEQINELRGLLDK